MNGRLFMISSPTPITMISPPRPTVYAAVTTLLSTPVHSSTVRGASYSDEPNRVRIAVAFPFASKFLFT